MGRLDRSWIPASSFSTRDEFVLDLPDGCFGGWVRIPSTWKYWRLEPVGDQHNWWIAFWYPDDDRGLGPYVLNQQLIINQPFKAPFRLQGNGRVRFYTDISSHELESRAK